MQPISNSLTAALSQVGSPTSELKVTDWRPELDAYEPSLVAAREACAQFRADMAADATPYWLCLSSAVNGCGKTMLAEQTYKACYRLNPDAKSLLVYSNLPPGHEPPRRRRSVWLQGVDFARRLREHHEYDLPEYLGADWLVCLDDMGVTRDPTDFIADAYFRLAQARLGKWTLWTTNLDLEQISDRIDARVASRLIRDRNRFITIKAGDYSLRAK